MDKKNILVISDFYGHPASGKVVKEYITGMKSLGFNIRVVTYQSLINEDYVQLISTYLPFNLRQLILNTHYNRLNKIFVILFKLNLDLFFINKNFNKWKIIEKENFKSDFVIQFVSGDSLLTSFILALKLKNKFNAKYYIHFLDPKPGLIEWDENRYVVNSTKKMLRRFIRDADRISAISKEMLNVLRSYYSFEVPKESILPMVIQSNNFDSSEKIKSKHVSVLYLGSIYGKRNIEPFLNAISILSESNIFLKVKFVGSSINLPKILSKYPNLKGMIETLPWENNINPIVQNSDILLDLNANLDFDPFISSKLFTYLGFKKPILVLCTKTSSAYDFSKGFEAVYPSENEVGEIISNLKKILNTSCLYKERFNQIKSYAEEQLMKEYLFF